MRNLRLNLNYWKKKVLKSYCMTKNFMENMWGFQRIKPKGWDSSIIWYTKVVSIQPITLWHMDFHASLKKWGMKAQWYGALLAFRVRTYMPQWKIRACKPTHMTLLQPSNIFSFHCFCVKGRQRLTVETSLESSDFLWKYYILVTFFYRKYYNLVP